MTVCTPANGYGLDARHGMVYWLAGCAVCGEGCRYRVGHAVVPWIWVLCGSSLCLSCALYTYYQVRRYICLRRRLEVRASFLPSICLPDPTFNFAPLKLHIVKGAQEQPLTYLKYKTIFRQRTLPSHANFAKTLFVGALAATPHEPCTAAIVSRPSAPHASKKAAAPRRGRTPSPARQCSSPRAKSEAP